MIARRIKLFPVVHLHALIAFWLVFSTTSGFAQLVHDGSFELQPRALSAGNEGWTICAGNPDVQVLDGYGTGIYGIHTPAANGQRYLGMAATEYGLEESIGQAMTIVSGNYYFGNVALFRSTLHQSWNGTGQLQLWGGKDCSDHDELLWSSGTVRNVDAWQYYPIEFNAARHHNWLSLVVVLDAGSGEMTYLALDDFFLDNSILAMDFLQVAATPLASGVSLNWETSALPDATTFAVESSANGSDFQTVAHLSGAADNTHFQSLHTPSQSGTQYYRIQALDAGGHMSISAVISVHWAPIDGLQVFPNPAQDRIHISLGADMKDLQQIRLLDMQGREVLMQPCAGSFADISLPSDLANGAYQLAVQVQGRVVYHRVMVAR